MDEVFVQGSCDAMIMAWNLVDAINKSTDVYDPVVVIDGVEIPRALFVDDILEIVKTFFDLDVTITGNEIFEKINRICFKQSKCKLICCNCIPPDEFRMNDVILEVVEDHEYLGTIISALGRRKDLVKRVADCKGVLNEITEICKTSGVSEVCLGFIMFLIDACFKSKFKHGCEVWDKFTKKELTSINQLLPNTFKRILQVPISTPTSAVKHDLGIIDLDLEVAIERILLASKILRMDDARISKRLLKAMMDKKVPGFCTNLEESLKLIGVGCILDLNEENDPRKFLKKLASEIQSKRIKEDMLKGSKTDGLMLNFTFTGCIKEYLVKLPFEEARIVFMWRSKMFPTKCNFPGRWSRSRLCNFCCRLDTDEHLLGCCGYMDIHEYRVQPEVFLQVDSDIDDLRFCAQILLKIYERLLVINEDKDLNSQE